MPTILGAARGRQLEGEGRGDTGAAGADGGTPCRMVEHYGFV